MNRSFPNSINKCWNQINREIRVIESTIEIKTNFLYPTRVGKAYGYGRIVKSGKNLVFLEGHLKQDDRIVVTATSTAVIVDMPTSRASILSKK